MVRSLKTTIEYTASVFRYQKSRRVMKNLGEGWSTIYLTPTDCSHTIEEKRYHSLALNLGSFFCSIKIINPILFPSFVKINGIPYAIKQGQSVEYKKHGKILRVSRLPNTKTQNYYIVAQAD
jgi:hypothetical protein